MGLMDRLLGRQPRRVNFQLQHVAPDERHEPGRTFLSAVAGEGHANPHGTSRQRLLAERVRVGDSVILVREPDNPHDANAIALWWHDGAGDGDCIGYIPRAGAGRMARQIDDETPITATVHQVTGGTRDKPSRGVVLEITVWRKRRGQR